MFENDANETDVREELVTPFLTELGYQRGTANDIRREPTLKYNKESLGRKKTTDRELQGKADYVLSVAGAGRWVLEVKRPSEPLDEAVFGQALSYAKHPEVSAAFAVSTNGKMLTIHSANQTAVDEPILTCTIGSPVELAYAVTGLLSPKAIRRQCKLPNIGKGQPIGPGFSAAVNVVGGHSLYEETSFELDPQTPLMFRDALEQELSARMHHLKGYRANIIGGKVIRDEHERIVAKLEIAMDRQELIEFAQQKGLMDVEYICLDNRISTDATRPSTFDVVGNFHTEAGEIVYDVLSKQSSQMGFPLNSVFTGSAAGHLIEDKFVGSFDMQFDFTLFVPNVAIGYKVKSVGRFEVKLG